MATVSIITKKGSPILIKVTESAEEIWNQLQYYSPDQDQYNSIIKPFNHDYLKLHSIKGELIIIQKRYCLIVK